MFCHVSLIASLAPSLVCAPLIPARALLSRAPHSVPAAWPPAAPPTAPPPPPPADNPRSLVPCSCCHHGSCRRLLLASRSAPSQGGNTANCRRTSGAATRAGSRPYCLQSQGRGGGAWRRSATGAEGLGAHTPRQSSDVRRHRRLPVMRQRGDADEFRMIHMAEAKSDEVLMRRNYLRANPKTRN